MNQHVTEYYWWLIINEVVDLMKTDSDDLWMEDEEITDIVIMS